MYGRFIELILMEVVCGLYIFNYFYVNVLNLMLIYVYFEIFFFIISNYYFKNQFSLKMYDYILKNSLEFILYMQGWIQ